MQVCQDRLANKMGYANGADQFATRALPPNTCAICGGELPSLLELAAEEETEEKEEKEGVVRHTALRTFLFDPSGIDAQARLSGGRTNSMSVSRLSPYLILLWGFVSASQITPTVIPRG